ncbi:hypothetical protein LGR54_01720 [Ancylobacter sp. Lp-2]|uniref:tudor domain-containing protein n=1 Tax=Ancylobacter sp. Lp-2 TaxID=2881339 RepID=UPI001E57C63B|nr:tudor domain-containing protein [Ancylobacter sp. Lp-2]MCB4767310.1 hypothetical protein [Ancylobacter sp. Lp-2]
MAKPSLAVVAKPQKLSAARPAAVVLFGRDSGGKPHAASFFEADADSARSSAAIMGLKLAELDSDALRAAAAQLPAGKVYSSGKAFVPFVKGQLYAELVKTLGMTDDVPVSEEKEAEHASLAPTLYDFSGSRLPTDWGDIKLGSLVLATAEPNEGWWEATITEVKASDLFVLKWRDWPDEPLFLRTKRQLALLPPPDRAVG